MLFLKPPSSLTPLLFLNLYTGSKSISVLSIKFFLLHIKFLLRTAQPGYIRSLISVDSPHIETRSSSSVTLSRPSSSSSLKITDRSFRYASHWLWNKLPASFCQPNPDHSFSHSSQSNSLSSSVSLSPLSLSITHTLFHSKLKRYLFLKSFPQIKIKSRSADFFRINFALKSYSYYSFIIILFSIYMNLHSIIFQSLIPESESECKYLTCNQKPTGSQFSLLHEPN